MFNFFKRKRLLSWELDLLMKIADHLPTDYSFIKEQLKDDIIKGVILGLGDIPNYVTFNYNESVHDKYFNRQGRDFLIQGIEVFNLESEEYEEFDLYVAFGVISGYVVPSKKFTPDLNKIRVTSFKKKEFGEQVHNDFIEILSQKEKELINLSGLYEVEVDGKILYSIEELEDGNFVGVDMNKVLYNVKHDPPLIERLNVDLITYLKYENKS